MLEICHAIKVISHCARIYSYDNNREQGQLIIQSGPEDI